MVVGGTVWLLTLPVLAAVMLLVYVDLRYGQQFLGGSDGVYDRIAWSFWQPTLYVFAVPALGIIADVVPVFARRRHHRHSTAMALIGLFGALAFGGWAQIGFSVDGQSDPTDWLYDGVWIAVGFLAVVAVVGLLGLWAATLGRGQVRLGTPLILALFAGLLIGGGVAAGAVTVIEEANVLTTTWASGQEILMVLGTLVAAAAGLAFWAPKIYGKLLPDGLVRLGATLLTIGAGVAAVAYGIAGLYDQPRSIAASLDGVSEIDTVETLNLVAAVGLVVAVAGALGVVGALLAPKRGRAVADDPWEGNTLEWATTSPPPVGNFATLPEVTSEAPLYDARYAAAPAAATASTEASG
jgi:cytochrome c oxidase subunit I